MQLRLGREWAESSWSVAICNQSSDRVAMQGSTFVALTPLFIFLTVFMMVLRNSIKCFDRQHWKPVIMLRKTTSNKDEERRSKQYKLG